MASTTTIGTTINIQLASITTIKTSFSRVNCCIKHCCTGIKPGNAAWTAGPRSQAAVNLQVAVFYVPGIWLHMAPLFTVDIRKFHDTVLLWPSKVDVFWFSWSFSVGCTLCFGHLPLFGRNLPSLKYWYVGIPWPLTPLKSWPVWTFHDFFWLATKICYSYVVASSSLRISAWRKASIHCQHNPWHGLEDPCDTRLRDSCRGLWMEVTSGNACCIGNCGHSNLWKFLDWLQRWLPIKAPGTLVSKCLVAGVTGCSSAHAYGKYWNIIGFQWFSPIPSLPFMPFQSLSALPKWNPHSTHLHWIIGGLWRYVPISGRSRTRTSIVEKSHAKWQMSASKNWEYPKRIVVIPSNSLITMHRQLILLRGEMASTVFGHTQIVR